MRGTTVLPGTRCRAPRTGEPPMHRLEVPARDALPFVAGTFDSVGPMSRADFPHRHTFHEIVLVTGGAGRHVIDLTRWELRPPQLCVLAPGQVHHWDARGVDGFVVLFTDDFLLDHPADRDLLRGLSERPLNLSEPAAAAAARLIRDLEDEYRHAAEGAGSVLRALLHVLVVRATRWSGAPAASVSPPASAEFVRLLGDPEPPLWTVGEYARRLGVTAGYLTRSVRAATGRTPAQLIREARAKEAKRLLASTRLTVRQVAARVGFADPAYFCRFFRRETGARPGDFRRGGTENTTTGGLCPSPGTGRRA